MQYAFKDVKWIQGEALEQVSYKDVSIRTPSGRAQDHLQPQAALKRPQPIPKLSCAASFKDHTRTPPIEITF